MPSEHRLEPAPTAVPARPSADDVFKISDLCDLLETYLEDYQVAEVYRAYLFGAEAHEGQKRRSGEPYIYHPLAVARVLAEMRMDYKSIMAAILHDVIEDTPTAKEQLATEFSEEVAELVDGVSKLTRVHFESRAEAQAENFRKMVLAMVQDIRVILIKLADRLHNMRTIDVLPPPKRRRIARETLEIYVPIANRLGMNTVRMELQDLGFAALYPMRYRILKEAVKKARGNRKEIIQKIEKALKQRLAEEGIDGSITGREKHLHSIYQKMRQKHLSFSEVMDVYAFRIIVDRVDTCYRTLGIVHNLYKPVPGKFKDYIAIPKANGYQSLHTVLFGPYGVPMEVQVRTEDMHKLAEAGIAAHWLYKTTDAGPGSQARAREWLRELIEMQKSTGNSLEFLENVKIDLFPDGVYVFTPKGDIMELPRGATAVDFAYTVHSDIGHSCVAAKVDRRLVPLRTQLQTGQQVEVITAPGAKPNPAWLNFVVTGKARSAIRHYLKNLRRDEAVTLGRRLLERSLGQFNLSVEGLSRESVAETLEEFKLETLDDLLEDIGLGNRMALLVARQLASLPETVPAPSPVPAPAGDRPKGFRNMLTRYAPTLFGKDKPQPRPLAIQGTEGIVVTYAKCCRPIPGDRIVGFVTSGRGIVIHTDSCKNLAEYKDRPEKWIDVKWERDIKGEFPVEIRVGVINQRGVLATVAATIAEMEANVENVHVEDRDGRYTDLVFVIDVRDRRHLANIMRRIRSIHRVNRITRAKG